MTKTNDSGASNNYSEFFYFPPPPFMIEKGIDYLTLSFSISKRISRSHIGNFFIADEHFFNTFLISNSYKRTGHHLLKKKKKGKKEEEALYKYKDDYFRVTDGNTVELFYMPKTQFIPYIVVKIHDPNLEIVNMFQSCFQKHYLIPNLSDLELRFDFYTDNIIKMREFLKYHLFFRYQRSKSFSKKTTYYTNDIRKDGKGMRIYTKPFQKYARLEIRLKRAILKKNRIVFPLQTIDDLELSEFFSFKEINVEKLFKYLKRNARGQINALTQKRSEYHGLLERTIYSWLDSLLSTDDGKREYFMTRIEALKTEANNIPDYSRFLKPIDDFNVEFNRQVSGQRFLKG